MPLLFNSLLLHLGSFAFFIAVTPSLFTAFWSLSLTYTTIDFLKDACLLLVTSYIGYFNAYCKYTILESTRLRPVVQKILNVLIHLILITICLVLIIWHYISLPIGSILLIVLGSLLYVKYYKSYDLDYSDTLHWEMFFVAVVIYIPAALLMKQNWLGLWLILLACIYMLLHNQCTLEEMLKRTQKNTPMIDRIKRTNIKWLSLLFVLIVILYPLRSILASFIGWVSRTFFHIIGSILYFLFSLIPNRESPADLSEPGAAASPLPLEVGETNSWLDTLLWVFVIVMLIAFRKQIYQGLKLLFKTIGNLLRQLWRFMFQTKPKADLVSDAYSEVIEDLSASLDEEMQHNQPPKKRKWKRQVRSFLKSEPTEANYRLGMQLLLQGYLLEGHVLNSSYTLRELSLNEALNYLPNTVTPYEAIRYGSKALTEASFNLLKEHLKTLI